MAPATLAGFKGLYPVLKQNADSGSDAAIQTAMEEVGERGHSWGSSEDAYIYFLNLDFQIRFLKSGENLAQRDDGGFSMSQLIGAWKRHDDTPLDTSSDGYATGLIAFALEQVEAPQAQAPLKRALAWLSSNQIESDSRWPAVSLNNNRPVCPIPDSS